MEASLHLLRQGLAEALVEEVTGGRISTRLQNNPPLRNLYATFDIHHGRYVASTPVELTVAQVFLSDVRNDPEANVGIRPVFRDFDAGRNKSDVVLPSLTYLRRHLEFSQAGYNMLSTGHSGYVGNRLSYFVPGSILFLDQYATKPVLSPGRSWNGIRWTPGEEVFGPALKGPLMTPAIEVTDNGPVWFSQARNNHHLDGYFTSTPRQAMWGVIHIGWRRNTKTRGEIIVTLPAAICCGDHYPASLQNVLATIAGFHPSS